MQCARCCLMPEIWLCYLLQEFDGRWVVEPGGSGAAPVTTLRYEIALVPKLSIPSAAIVHVVRSGLPANIKAIARRAEEVCTLASGRQQVLMLMMNTLVLCWGAVAGMERPCCCSCSHSLE